MGKLRRIIKAYLVIGFIVGAAAWMGDSTSEVNTILAIPVIAIIWPIWLLLLIVFG